MPASPARHRDEPAFQFNEERQRLLQDPSFRLIKVVRGPKIAGHSQRTIKSLTVVTPAVDPEIARDVEKRGGWYSLSHLWGDPATWVDWDGADVVDAITGEVISARVHPDKLEEIMALLKLRAGYWWIDFFCARMDTPLVIMGDIYRLCKKCFALIDSSCKGFYVELYDSFKLAARMAEQHLQDAAQAYLDRVSKRGHPSGKSAWNHLLRDLLCWSFEHFENGLYDYFEDLLQDATDMGGLLQLLKRVSLDGRVDDVLEYFDLHGPDAADEKDPFIKDPTVYLQHLRRHKVDNLDQCIEAIAEMLNSQWMSRVWTLQELALPGIVWPPPPWIAKRRAPTNESFARFTDLQLEFSKLLKVVAKAYEIRVAAIGTLGDQEGGRTWTVSQLMEAYQRKDPVLAHIYNDYRKLFEVVIAIGQASGRKPKCAAGRKMEKLILNSFATSQRKALYPVDYVYGVLGLLDIDIPRLVDPDEVWYLFSEKLQERHPDILVPRDVDLSKATKMHDVYGKFGFISETFDTSAIMEFIGII